MQMDDDARPLVCAIHCGFHTRLGYLIEVRRVLAGWTRDGSTEEIASWNGSTETLTGGGSEEEKTPRGDRERIDNERRQDEGLDGLDGSLSS